MNYMNGKINKNKVRKLNLYLCCLVALMLVVACENDAIFKFKRYEDASLTYTGINRHIADEVGGWDTTIRKEQYEKTLLQSAILNDKGRF